MKKITLTLVLACLSVLTLKSQDIRFLPSYTARFMSVDPIDSVKVTQYGAGAIVSYMQVTTDSVWIKIEHNATQNFPATPYFLPMKFLGNTVSSYSDTINVVMDTTVTWVRIISYSDAAGANPIDTTPVKVMVRKPRIISYSLIPTVGGFKPVVQYDPGNSPVTVHGIYALDRQYQSQGPPFVNTTMFSIGNVLTQSDSVWTGVYNQYVYWKFDITQPDGTMEVRTDSVKTLIAVSQPTAQWLGNPTSTSPTSISWTVSTESFGIAGILTVYYREQQSGLLVDSTVVNTPAVVGSTPNSGNIMNLLSGLWYEVAAIFKTSVGVPVILPMKLVQTQGAAVPLTNTITNITVGQYVQIEYAYTVPTGDTATFTVGYGPYQSNVLDFTTDETGVQNNGSSTLVFPLPLVAGWYTAHVYGYNQQITTFSVEDTMHFYVSSLTGIEEEAMSPFTVQADLYQVYDLKGGLLLEATKLQYTFLPKQIGIVVVAWKNNKRIYSKKFFIQ